MIKEGPSISVDVSKSGVAYQGWLSYGKPHGKARKADMTRTGLSAIKALADDLGAKDGVVVPVAYEDTGIYVKVILKLSERECGHFIGPSFRILANIPLSLCSQALP